MSGDHHDLVVVGGGIHGASLALAATTASHSVPVLEPAEGIDVR